MKKILLVCIIALMGFALFLGSCKKDKDECCCYGDCESMADIKAEGYDSCAEFKDDYCGEDGWEDDEWDD